jgi:hypothetical protein
MVWMILELCWIVLIGDAGFDFILARGEVKARSRRKAKELRGRVAEWLSREVYA